MHTDADLEDTVYSGTDNIVRHLQKVQQQMKQPNTACVTLWF
jgi:hypothetical protein